MIVPDGFALPPTPYLLVLGVGVAILAAALIRLDPPFDERTVLALVPWMGVGGSLHVVYVLALAPVSIEPFLGTPAVYISTAIIAGMVWIVGLRLTERSDPVLGIVGMVGLVGVVVYVLTGSLDTGWLWPVVAVALSIVVTGIVWGGLAYGLPRVVSVTAGSGLAVVFGHVLDGISTAIGVDVLQAGERSPVPRAIMRLAEQLPTAEALGAGWLFVLVKVLMAVGIVWLFVPFVEDTERQGHVVLALLAAVGLGPGVHNLLLFVVAG